MKKERILVSIQNIKLMYTSVPEIFATFYVRFQKKTKDRWHSWYTYRSINWRCGLGGFPLRPMNKPGKLTDGEFREVCKFLETNHKTIVTRLRQIQPYDIVGLSLNRSCKTCCERICNSCERK